MIRNFLVFLLIFVGFYIVQETLLMKLTSFTYGISPNLALMFFCLLSIQYGRLGAQILGFTGGLIQDFFSGTPVCFYAMIYLIMGYVFGSLHLNTRFNNLQAVPILMTFATIVSMILALTISEIFGIKVNASFLSPLFWGQTILNILVGLPLFFFARFLAQKIGLTASWRRLRHE